MLVHAEDLVSPHLIGSGLDATRMDAVRDAFYEPVFPTKNARERAVLSFGASTKSCAHSVRSYWRSFEAQHQMPELSTLTTVVYF